MFGKFCFVIIVHRINIVLTIYFCRNDFEKVRESVLSNNSKGFLKNVYTCHS